VARFNNAIWRKEMTEVKPLSVRLMEKACLYNDAELRECAGIAHDGGVLLIHYFQKANWYWAVSVMQTICILLLVAKQWGWL
jgi:hypothetical protein